MNYQNNSIGFKIIKSFIPICIPLIVGNIYLLLLVSIKNIWFAIDGQSGAINIIALLENNIAAGTATCSLPLYLMLYKKDIQQREKKRKEKINIFLISSILFIAVISSISINNIIEISNIGKLFPNYIEVLSELYTSNIALDIIGLGVLVPLAEELLFRGILYQRAKGMIDKKAAAFLISILFGIYHGNVVQGIFAFVLSLLIIFIMEESGSIVGAILFHIGANITAVIFENMQIHRKLYSQLDETLFLVIIVLEGVVMIMSIYLFQKIIKKGKMNCP